MILFLFNSFLLKVFLILEQVWLGKLCEVFHHFLYVLNFEVDLLCINLENHTALFRNPKLCVFNNHYGACVIRGRLDKRYV